MVKKQPNYKYKPAQMIEALGTFLNNVKKPWFILAFVTIVGILILIYMIGNKYLDLQNKYQQNQLKLSREEINSTYEVKKSIQEQNEMMQHQNKLIEEHNKRHK